MSLVPKQRKNMNMKKNNNQVSVGQIGYLTNQVNRLTKLMTQLSENYSPTRQVWVKKSDLPNLVADHSNFKGKNTYIPR